MVRPLKDYSITRPPNLAEEDSNIREQRLEDEKEKRIFQREDLRDATTKAEKRDNPKPVKSEAGLSGNVPPTLSS
jgi:hypothetical protein